MTKNSYRLCVQKFETLVAPSKLFSKLLKFCMMYFITLINKMTDEEVKHLKFDFSWITLLDSISDSKLVNQYHLSNYLDNV